MTPKSETMWMAWHPKFGYTPRVHGVTMIECKKLADRFKLLLDTDWVIEEVTIQPKKRGKG